MAETALQERISSKAMRFWCLLAAITIYAFWGTPRPDSPGGVEVVAGLLLITAAGLPQAARALIPVGGAGWRQMGSLLLLYGLTVPVLTGIFAGNSPSGMLRDIVPFLFLLMPVFLYPFFTQDRPERYWDGLLWLTGAVVLLGLVFSSRVLLPVYPELARFQPVSVSDPFLLANAPTVLFSALLLIGLCGWSLYRGDLFKSAVCIVLAVVPLVTMALITQRASIGAVCLSIVVLLSLGIVRRPLRMVWPLILLAGGVMAYWPVIADITQNLMRKTSIVGFNMRWQEARAVMEVLSGSLWTVLFGKGWGATVASPAVGGAVVNFTHSLLTTYWLKTGLVGLGFVLAYLVRIGLILLPLFYRYPVVALALAGPFLIDILLYASFKSLDFGLILLLIVSWGVRTDLLHRASGYSIE